MSENDLSHTLFSADADATSIPSIIKWTGGKRSQAIRIAKHMPSYRRYFEPFLGGGALLYLASHPGAIAGDIYEPLIDLWKLIQSDPDRLISSYENLWRQLGKDLDEYEEGIDKSTKGVPATYYEVRRRFNESPNAIDLNFLMRTCVNGIIRFNSNMEFNNSFHLSRRGMRPDRLSSIVSKWSSRIQGVEFVCTDYKSVLARAETEDLVYLDPPYAGTKQRYAAALSKSELFNELEALNSRGVKWLLSYDGKRGLDDFTVDVPKELYKSREYLDSGNSAVRKVLSGKSEMVSEALYFNFES